MCGFHGELNIAHHSYNWCGVDCVCVYDTHTQSVESVESVHAYHVVNDVSQAPQ